MIPIVEGESSSDVTDRDIAIRSSRANGCGDVGEIASRELVTIDPQQDLDEALRLMADIRFAGLPVVEEDGKLVGIVAQADIANTHPTCNGDVVEDISK